MEEFGLVYQGDEKVRTLSGKLRLIDEELKGGNTE